MTFIKKFNRLKSQLKLKIKDFKKADILEKLDEVKDNLEDVWDDTAKKAKELDKKFEISKKVEKAKDVVVEKASDLKDDINEKVEAVVEGKITFDDFTKIELKVGKILEAEKIKKSKKLLKLKVDFGEDEARQVVSGIAEHYNPEDLINKKVVFVTNLLPRKIMGYESNGMILALSDDKNFSLIVPDKKRIKEGTSAS